MTTPPATPPTYGHLCTTLHDLLAHHYGTQFTDTDLDAAAEAAARWLDDILAGSHPRLGQLTPRDDAEAHYALNAALGISPQLRAEVDAQSGRRADNAAHMVAGYALLADLDRCPHGRHDTDPCLACPGGQSVGNPHNPPGSILGYDLYGHTIAVPVDPADRAYPDRWHQVGEHGQDTP